jgi:3-methyladenine DNA glycosylase AlkC
MTETKRKGARSRAEVPAEILARLNRGEIETANLVEWLAIDGRILLENVLTQNGRGRYLKPVSEAVNRLEKQTHPSVNQAIAQELYRLSALDGDGELLSILSASPSDLVRGWATVMIGADASLNIGRTLEKIRPFAADRHFNARECAWSAIRLKIIDNLVDSLDILSQWSLDGDENIRRFASEATRPRGVWCEHIVALKEDPEAGLPILEPLRSDPSRYVQNSVGNWLNDASKSRPDFVRELCARWGRESGTKETAYIVRRGLRTIEK